MKFLLIHFIIIGNVFACRDIDLTNCKNGDVVLDSIIVDKGNDQNKPIDSALKSLIPNLRYQYNHRISNGSDAIGYFSVQQEFGRTGVSKSIELKSSDFNDTLLFKYYNAIFMKIKIHKNDSFSKFIYIFHLKKKDCFTPEMKNKFKNKSISPFGPSGQTLNQKNL